MKEGYAQGLVELGNKVKDLVVLSADNAIVTRAAKLAEKHPNKFIQCGSAEQNMMGIAAGLALEGKVPFVSAHAAFNPGRNWDQLRVSVCYNKLNVKIIGVHAGFSAEQEGGTHHALEDIALARTLPNMIVIAPADATEARKATIAAGTMKGPVYIRLSKSPKTTEESTPFTIGRAEIMRAGKDCTIIACGAMVSEALKAAKKLEEQEIHCTVLNSHTIKPLDKHTILSSAKITGCVITAEEHQTNGGLGSAVAELLSQNLPVPVKMIGVDDKFGTSGTLQELHNKHGLTSANIVKTVKETIMQKCSGQVVEEHEKVIHKETDMPFKLHDGGTIKSIPGLQKALLNMKEHTFRQHCNKNKNDFSKWILDVFEEKGLAKKLRNVYTRVGMANVITRWLK